MKTYFIFIAFLMMFYSSFSYAENLSTSVDAYSECVDQTIEELSLESINNAVVEICSNKVRAMHERNIVKRLDSIKKQSEIDHQPERYKDIMKSQQLWKNYVDQECSNAGSYIGSPMYAFCPMIEYGKRAEQLAEYTY